MSSSPTRCIQLLVAICWYAQVAKSCIHDSLEHQVVAGTQSYDDSHPFLMSERKRRLYDEELQDSSTPENRKLRSTTFEPIRMTPYYDNSSLNKLPDATRAVVFDVVQEAIQRIHRALEVVPVSGNLLATRFCTSTFSTTPPVCYSVAENELCLEMPIPSDHFSSTKYCGSCSTSGCTNCKLSPAGEGVPNTDFLIYVRAESTVNCQSGTTLAYASTCQQDQYDRPTFGMVNFCPNKLSIAATDLERQVATALHEFTHALGFSSRFFPLMRHEDGTPRTPRDASGKPPIYTSGVCHNGKKIDYYVAPSNTTVKYSTERNHVVAKLVTPRVRAFVQDHFDCLSLEGAELESQDGGCLGSHWEERLFEPEFMTPIDSYRNVFSALTLAFFADSGWYRVNALTSEIMHYGRKKGCAFATDKCVDPETQTSLAADHFCTTSDAQGCSADARSRSVCSLSAKSQTIPIEYQYFPGSPTKGGANTFADFCPMNVGYAAGDCSLATNLLKLGTTTINAYGETYCPSCKCTSTSLRSIDSTGWGINPSRQSGCYAMRCITTTDDSTNSPNVLVEVTIPRSKTKDVIAVNCTRKGDKLSVPGFSGGITCPDPLIVCEYDDPSRVLLADIVRFSESSSQSKSGSSGSELSQSSADSTLTTADSSRHSQSSSESSALASSDFSSNSQSITGSSNIPTGIDVSSTQSDRDFPVIDDASIGSQSYSGNASVDNGYYNSTDDDASGRYQQDVGTNSNSSSNSATDSGSRAKTNSGSFPTDTIANNVGIQRHASDWVLLAGVCLALQVR